MNTLFLFRRGNKIPMGGDTETNCGAETEGKNIQRLAPWGSIPYTVTKRRHSCGCREVLVDRSLIQLSPERLCLRKYRGGYSQPAIDSTESQMEDLEKGPKAFSRIYSPLGGTTI